MRSAFVLAWALIVLSGCSADPKKETTLNEKFQRAQMCALDAMTLVMSAGDPRAMETFCERTPAKLKLIESNPQLGIDSNDQGKSK